MAVLPSNALKMQICLLNSNPSKDVWSDTWENSHFYIPEDGLEIGPAIPIRHVVELPGQNGKLDYSQFYGDVIYRNRIIKVKLQGEYSETHPSRWFFEYSYNALYSKVAIRFSNDIQRYWYGYMKINSYVEDGHYAYVELEIDADPKAYYCSNHQEVLY